MRQKNRPGMCRQRGPDSSLPPFQLGAGRNSICQVSTPSYDARPRVYRNSRHGQCDVCPPQMFSEMTFVQWYTGSIGKPTQVRNNRISVHRFAVLYPGRGTRSLLYAGSIPFCACFQPRSRSIHCKTCSLNAIGNNVFNL